MKNKEVIFALVLFILLSSATADDVSNETIIEDITITNFIPKEFKLGDGQFSIQVQNNKNETLDYIIAIVSGKGFSTYETIPIDVLDSGDKSYIIISGNFKEAGNINLTIKINREFFYPHYTNDHFHTTILEIKGDSLYT